MEGYTINIANKKPLVNKKNAKLRVSHCKEQLRRLKNKECNLKKIIFSDESGIKSGKGARSEYYRKRGKREIGKARISMANRSKFKKHSNRLKYSIFYIVFFYLAVFLLATLLTTLLAKGIKVQVWGAIWIGGRSELEFVRDPINTTTLNSTRYIRRILNRHVKKAIKKGKLATLFYPLFLLLYNI